MNSKAAPVLQIIALAVAIFGWSLSAIAGEVYVLDGDTVGAYPTSGATVKNTLVTLVPNMNSPAGVAVSGANLFVLRSGSLLGGGQLGSYNATTGATVNASLPVGLAVTVGIAASGEDLFVTNSQGNKIGEYTTSGTTVNASLVTGLKFPTVVAVSGNDLFVANAGTASNNGVTDFTPGSGSIGEYNATTGAVIHKTLVTGLTSNGNNYPVGIAVSGGNLYVTNLNTVAEYNASTGALESLSLIPGVIAPYGIAAYGGKLFVADEAQSTIGEYTNSGSAVNASLITGLGSPTAITVAPEPSTCVLLATGAALLLMVRRRAMNAQIS